MLRIHRFLDMAHLRAYGASVDLLNRATASGEPIPGGAFACSIVPSEKGEF